MPWFVEWEQNSVQHARRTVLNSTLFLNHLLHQILDSGCPATSSAQGLYGSDAAASSRREAPSPEPTDPAAEEQAPVQPALAYPNLQGPNSPTTIRRYWTKSRNSNIYTFRAKLWHEYHTQTNASAGIPFEGRAVEIDGDGNCFARAVARALGLPSYIRTYKEVKERTKTFFLEHLPALTTAATGEPNTRLLCTISCALSAP